MRALCCTIALTRKVIPVIVATVRTGPMWHLVVLLLMNVGVIAGSMDLILPENVLELVHEEFSWNVLSMQHERQHKKCL